jgi:non-specific serine/threonine protein kinase
MIGKTISHYKIIEKIGEGGMGEVYLADDLKLERKVAIKFLPEHLTKDKENVERFEREAKAIASLNHPNIVTIYDVIEADNQICIVMEYVDGDSLRNKIDKGVSDLNEILKLTKQICDGLSEAHKADIVHRDIKPENILIDSHGRVKILDFGLVKLKGVSKLTKDSSTLGTVNYMSPEQIQGKDVDHRSDIWSLGILLYEMLSGEPPFKGEYESSVHYAILNEEPKPLADNILDALINVVYKGLHKNPDDRYQNVDDLIVDLKRLNELSELKTSQTKPDISTTKKKSGIFVTSLIVSILIVLAVFYFVIINPSREVSSLPERKKLVVLPFKNLGSPEDEYFTDGITEEITSRLSEIKQLGVIGRTSADRYKNTEKSINQIGEELGVDYLLEGSVRWEKVAGSESRIRVTPQLIIVSDGTQIWTKRYDAILESVFDVQSDIANKVANALDITLLGAEQKSISKKLTNNLEAYDYYLRGKYYLSQIGIPGGNYRVAEKMFLKAVDLDSNFVLPYLKLAQINTEYYWFYRDRNKSRLTRTKYLIDKATEINPDIPEIYIAWGQYYYQGFLDYDKALSELENGLKIYPDNSEILEWISHIKRRQGKFKEAISYLKRSIELDPISILYNHIGQTYLLLKKYEDAEKYFNIAISNIPEAGTPYEYKAKLYIFRNGDVNRAFQILKASLDVVNQGEMWITSLLIQVRILQGKYDEALKILSDEPANVFYDQFTFEPKSKILAFIYGLQNNKNLEKDYYDSARVVIEEKLKELPDDARLYSALGLVLAGLGKREEAIREGKRATELLPITKEAWRGFYRELDLAKIYTMVGEYDLAIDKLEYLLSIPGELSVSYIKLDPVWRPLLKIPRFQNLLEQNK